LLTKLEREGLRLYGLRCPPAFVLLVWIVMLLPSGLGRAQGVTAAGVRGTVTGDLGQKIEATVSIKQDSTGFALDVRASDGHFLIQGLEPGGPYTITARALGFPPRRRERVYLELGAFREIDFVLQSLATRLDTAHVSSESTNRVARVGAGVGTTISASLLDRLPAPNRDLFDFMRLVPEISTNISVANAGLSGAGEGFRYNNFFVNGVSERTLSGGVSPAYAGNRSLPLAAVQEYEVMLSPYDVRYGDFVGALVNAVTKSGTNSFHGSTFVYWRDDRLSRRLPADSGASFARRQYGLSFGGPLIRDRLRIFVASELQHFTYSGAGPYVGQPSNAQQPVPVSLADIARFDAIMRSYGLTAGSPGAVENRAPLKNLFTRLDLSLPVWSSWLAVWNNYSASDQLAFARASQDTFSLSSYQGTSVSQARQTTAQLHTALPRAGGGHNELLVSARYESLDGVGVVRQPIVRVADGGVTLNSGTPESIQAGGFRSRELSVKDGVTLPLGASHVLALGVEMTRFRLVRGVDAVSYGTWSFASLDAFQAGQAQRYDVGVDFGNGSAPVVGSQYATFAGDQWWVSDRLSLTGGVRADLLAFDGHAPYNPAVDSLFGRSTDQMPRRRVELSPRAAFVWQMPGRAEQRLRGGVGVFTSRYPLAWVQAALQRYGVGNGTLSCNMLGSTTRFPPAFSPSPAPTTCTGGAAATPNVHSDVDLLDRNLRLERVARASLTHELRIATDLVLTNEALVSRGLSDIAFRNLNLNAPLGTDPYGRLMFGTIATTGQVSATRRSDFREVIELVDVSNNHSYQLTTRLERKRTDGLSASISYTYSRVRDVQTPLYVNRPGIVTWATARAMSGREDDLSPSISANDIPHRVVVVGAYSAPWRRARTTLSLYYVGESGRPFTYIAYGVDGRGDLNGDGSNANDPIYVPRDARDTAEIEFSGDSTGADTSATARQRRESAQRNGFEQLIQHTPCLRRQRGQIMQRNSCREPWSSTTMASLRQEVPFAGRVLDLQLDVFNLLNLLRRDWGLRREALPALLEQYGQTASPVESSRPIFRYDLSRPAWSTLAIDSGAELQLAARYRF
jgi:carboxypeptidase family protein